MERDAVQRQVLPNPDIPPPGLTTCDAKDPDTTYNGKPRYCYNFFGLERYYAEGTRAIPARRPPGAAGVRLQRGGLGKGGTATIRDPPVLRRRDHGRRQRVRLPLDDHNHLIRPEDRLHLAMAIQ